jgi:hypothetical protein
MYRIANVLATISPPECSSVTVVGGDSYRRHINAVKCSRYPLTPPTRLSRCFPSHDNYFGQREHHATSTAKGSLSIANPSVMETRLIENSCIVSAEVSGGVKHSLATNFSVQAVDEPTENFLLPKNKQHK